MDKLEGNIINKLEELGIDYGNLKPFLINYLIKIEQIVIEKGKIQYEANKLLKNNDISVACVSKQLNCSRTTFYNHGAVLKKYIKLSEKKLKENNPFEIYEELRNHKLIIENQLKKMVERDVNNEILSNEIDLYLNTIKEKNSQIELLQQRNLELSKENRKLKKEILKSNIS